MCLFQPPSQLKMNLTGLFVAGVLVPTASQLKMVAPRHPFTKRLEAGDEMFSRAVASLA